METKQSTDTNSLNLQKQQSGQTNDTFKTGDYTNENDSSSSLDDFEEEEKIRQLIQKNEKEAQSSIKKQLKEKIPAVTIKENQSKQLQVKTFDASDLAKSYDLQIKKFQQEKSGIVKFDYFHIWKLFESKRYVAEEIGSLDKDVVQMINVINKLGVGLNNCPEGMIGKEKSTETIECKLCFTDDVKIWDAKHLGCYHYFCIDCFKDAIRNILEENKKWFEFKCFEFKCNKLMNYDFFKEMQMDQNEALMTFYLKNIGEDIAQVNPSIFACKRKGCDKFLSLPYEFLIKSALNEEKEVENLQQIYKGKYQPDDHFCSCYSLMCIGCEQQGHKPAKCQDAIDWRQNSKENILNKLSEAAIMQTTKPCPKCGVNIEKNEGCNHMKCTKCKTDYQWTNAIKDWREDGQSKPLKQQRMELLEMYNDLYEKSLVDLNINISTAFNTDFEKYKKRNLETKQFDSNTLERFFIALNHANKVCIKVRSFITWTYPLSFGMENNVALKEFNIKRIILKKFMEILNWFTQKVNISAVLWKIDQDQFKKQRNNLRNKQIKNVLFSYGDGRILAVLSKKKKEVNDGFLENYIKKLDQNRISLEDIMEQQTKNYRSDEWYKNAKFNFNLG